MLGMAALLWMGGASALAGDPEPAPAPASGGMPDSSIGGVGDMVGPVHGGEIFVGADGKGLQLGTLQVPEVRLVGDRQLELATYASTPNVPAEEQTTQEHMDRMTAITAALRGTRAGILTCWAAAGEPYLRGLYVGKVEARRGRLAVASLTSTRVPQPGVDACIRQGLDAVRVDAALSGTFDAEFYLSCRLKDGLPGTCGR